MNKNLANEEFVNRYLENELTGPERLEFENKLLHDSELREELDFQKDVIEGIKESRRLELKSRLSNIPISTPLYQTVGFKAIAVASITAGVGFGAYYLIQDNDDMQLSDIDLRESQVMLAEEADVPVMPDAITPIFEEETIADKPIESISQERPKTGVVAKNTESTPEPIILEPNVIEPEVVEAFDSEDISADDLGVDAPVNNLDNIKDNMESTVEIATIKDKRNKFHYQFFENKLYLLGNFSDMPYEIIELNTSQGKSYYLFYNESYFKLNEGQAKPAPLVKIENDSLVNELRVIQSNQK